MFTPLKDEKRYIQEQTGFTLTFSAYALIILAKPLVKATTTSLLITTTPPPRDTSGDGSQVWWIVSIVYPLSGLVGAGLIVTSCFRVRYGRLPFTKGDKEASMHPDFIPVKTKGQSALRLKLLDRENKSRNMYTEENQLSRMGVLMKESIDAKLRAEEDGEESGALVVHKRNKKIDPKHGADSSLPPHPISELVRSGVLMAPRSSVIDGANRQMLNESGGAGAPEKLEVNDLTVMADFGRGATSSNLDSDWDGLNIKNFTGTLGSGLYPEVDGEASSPWILSLHKGLGSMMEEGLSMSSGLPKMPSLGAALEPDAATDSIGKKGLSTKRQKVNVNAKGPQESAEADDGDEVAI